MSKEEIKEVIMSFNDHKNPVIKGVKQIRLGHFQARVIYKWVT